ncbi:MAG: C40 family peptidase [Solobacterium sp.]|nr:C40 family peptidase [Solobacterium sp.]
MTKLNRHTFYRAALCMGGALFLASGTDIRLAAENLSTSIPMVSLRSSDENTEDALRLAAGITSDVTVNGLNRFVNGLQSVRLNTASAVSPITTGENILVKVTVDKEPQIRLRSDHVTINRDDTFNPSAYIASVYDDAGSLPLLRTDGTVNTAEDGEYQITYTVVDLDGNTASAYLAVTVKEHEEVIRAREEEERRRREEEERRIREEEERRRQEEERRRQEEEERRRQEEQQRQQEQRQQEQSEQAYETMRQQVYEYSGSGINGQDIVNAAMAWVGNGIYVMGGTNPATGTDCSGFTQYVYRQFGIELNRTAAAQTANGYQVSYENALPGDLVLWNGHAAIYAGGGMVVQASNPSLGITYAGVPWGNSSGFLGFYRIPGVNE